MAVCIILVCISFLHVTPYSSEKLYGGRAISLKADLHGTTLSHTTSSRQAYDMNRFL